MGFHLAYRIVWWLAVLSNAVAAYFVMIATVTAYFAGYILNLFDGTVGVGTAGSALLAVIVLVWEWIPGIRPTRNALIYRIVWWFAFVSNFFRTSSFGLLVCLSAYVFFFGNIEPTDWLNYAGLCSSALLALIALLWGLTPPVVGTR